MERRSGARIIGFLVAVVVVFGLMGIVLYLVGGTVAGWALLLTGALGLSLIRLIVSPRGLKLLLTWVLALVLAGTAVTFGRQELTVSLPGVLTREAIRRAMWLDFMRGDGMLTLGAQYARMGGTWDSPGGYTLTVLDGPSMHLELLEAENGDPEKVIFLLHGGAYVVPLANNYRDMAVRYSNLSGGAAVALLDYRTAPANHYPAALEDAKTAWEYLKSAGYLPENIIVVGDSAGGNLAVVLTAALRDAGKPLPKALVLMSPWLDMASEGASHTYNLYRDPLFGRREGEAGENGGTLMVSYAGNTDLHDPYLSPVYGSFEGFPPILIQVGTWEVLESDSIDAAEKAAKAGVSVQLTRYEGMFHVFQMFGDFLPESKAAWAEVKEFIAAQWGK